MQNIKSLFLVVQKFQGRFKTTTNRQTGQKQYAPIIRFLGHRKTFSDELLDPPLKCNLYGRGRAWPIREKTT